MHGRKKQEKGEEKSKKLRLRKDGKEIVDRIRHSQRRTAWGKARQKAGLEASKTKPQLWARSGGMERMRKGELRGNAVMREARSQQGGIGQEKRPEGRKALLSAGVPIQGPPDRQKKGG